ncbi:hypothetical protein ACJ41O_003195 [Fusarium nematophilum]
MAETLAALQAIAPAIKAFQFALKVYDARQDAAVLENLARMVEKDLEFARAFRTMHRTTLRKHKLQKNWIVESIEMANTALDDFRACLLDALVADGEQPEIYHKAKYILFKYEKTMDLEKALRVAHSSLLVTISLMHRLASQDGEFRPSHRGRRCSTPRSRPATFVNRILRVSNHGKASDDNGVSPSEREKV